MHFLTVLPLALTASAFLVPASVEPVHINKIPSSAKNDKVTLQCDDCSRSVTGLGIGAIELQEGAQTSFRADIHTDGEKVWFNEHQIYPPSNGIPLDVKQAYGSGNRKGEVRVPISSAIEYKPVEYLSDGETQLFIHPISIEILALNDQVVHTESVEVRVADVNGELGLLPSRIRAYEASPYTESCTTVWCRVKGTITKKYNEWRAAAATKVNQWKGCSGGKKPGFNHGNLPIKGGPAKFGGSLRPVPHHGAHGAHGHHRHHHHHGFGQFMRYMVHAIFLPAFFGVCAGLIIGAFSWLVVTEVRRIRAARRASYILVEQVEIEEGRGDLPPKYEEMYREAGQETDDEKKELLQ